MSNFCENFILRYSHLSKEDLALLDTLSEKYDVLEHKDIIFTDDINHIISTIIIDALPYKVAYRLVNSGYIAASFPNIIPTLIAEVKDGIVFPTTKDLYGQELIDKEIERMNAFIKYKTLANES